MEKQLSINKKETQEAIGLSKDGYYDVLNGDKRISVKIMWRLVKFFKVPLENIINMPLYRENVSNPSISN